MTYIEYKGRKSRLFKGLFIEEILHFLRKRPAYTNSCSSLIHLTLSRSLIHNLSNVKIFPSSILKYLISVADHLELKLLRASFRKNQKGHSTLNQIGVQPGEKFDGSKYVENNRSRLSLKTWVPAPILFNIEICSAVKRPWAPPINGCKC